MQRQIVPARADVILRYFLRHPRAADDLEGIVRWRLRRLQIEDAVEESAAAIRWLVARGLLTARNRPGEEPLFALDEDKVDEAHRLLAGLRPIHGRGRSLSRCVSCGADMETPKAPGRGLLRRVR